MQTVSASHARKNRNPLSDEIATATASNRAATERSEPPPDLRFGVGQRRRRACDSGQSQEDAGEAVDSKLAVPEPEPSSKVEHRLRVTDDGRNPNGDQQQSAEGAEQCTGALNAGRDEWREREGDHRDCEHGAHAVAPAPSRPTACSRPSSSAIGAGGDPGT
jgi:hypothetical protein